MPVSLTRRAALGGAAALWLASCGGGDPPPASGPGSGAGLLRSLLSLERAVVAAYEFSVGALRPEPARYARAIRSEEQEHARELARLITGLGSIPPAGRSLAEYAPTFPALRSQHDALSFLEDLEQRQVRAYLEALKELPKLDLRTAVASIGLSEGRQLATIRELAGKDPMPHPFETGAL